ncbi:MAG TPA: energy transducer TonB [Blastocatellia bacterium]|nr:energy transducer TonB [Blastocatellia bacterium]
MFEPVLQTEPIWLRLQHELSYSINELRNNPAGFVREIFRDERKKESKQILLAALILVLITYSALMAVLIVLDIHRAIQSASGEKPEKVVYLDFPNDKPLPATARGEGIAGGSAGGGNHALTPASPGQLPRSSPNPPIVTPNPALPNIENPSLAVAPTIQDPSNSNPAVLPGVSIGLPSAPPGPPSQGPGEGGGLGAGKGQGAGDKTGPGSGNNGKPGGNGQGPGKTGPGGSVSDNPNGLKFGANATNAKARITFKPEPRYSQEALQNKIEGTVVVYVTLFANGTIGNPRIMSPLGYGLDEEAIKAAMQAKFVPKIQNGRPVDDTGSLTYTFRLTGKLFEQLNE